MPLTEKNIYTKEDLTLEKRVRDLVRKQILNFKGFDAQRIQRRTLTRVTYQTHSEDTKGIKIHASVPATIEGDTGFYLPTTNIEPASPFNGKEWTNPSNAQSVNGAYATATQGASARFSIWKGFTNLQNAIPSGVTITGLSVRCFASVDTVANLDSNGRKLTIQLTKDGVNVVGISKVTDVPLIVADAFVGAGGVNELWGVTLERSDFNSDFGIMISGSGISSPDTIFQIDYIQLIVHYKRDFTDGLGNTITDSFIQFWNSLGNFVMYLKKNTADLIIEKVNLVIKGTLTVEPQEVISGNTGAKSPTSNSEPGEDTPITAGQPWTNPGNAESSNNVYATANQTAEVKYQIWKGFNLNIPNGAIITGIEVKVEGKVSSGTGNVVVKLSKDGSVGVGNTGSDVNSWSTTDAIGTIGSSTDLWGTTWDGNDFGINFGVIIFGSSIGSLTYNLDHVTVTVYYTLTGDNSIDGNIISSVDGTYSLGSPTKRFKRIYTTENPLIDRFLSDGTWTKPSGAKFVYVRNTGAGAGGGGGAKKSGAADTAAGTGAGGGSIVERWFDADKLSATETVTVGAKGVGGAGATTVGNGIDGTAGGKSTFGSLLSAFGGGLGLGGAGAGARRAGAGGGTASVGGNGLNGGGFIEGGNPRNVASASTFTMNGVGGGGAGSREGNGGSGEWGGGAGGGSASLGATGSKGGSSLNAGAGGGSGGGGTVGGNAGGEGGARNSYVVGGGGAAGAGGNPGVDGTDGTDYAGGGGGGGGSATNGGKGGKGGLGAGGGGGGGCRNNGNGGNGGDGGSGEILVITYF